MNHKQGDLFAIRSANRTAAKFLTTTALTAASLVLFASGAKAANWGDHTYDEGDVSVDLSTPNVTNLHQTTDFVKAHGDGDITAGHTVNLAQPGSSSKYVLYDIKGDPTLIQGTLNANGQVYIFDQNGVIFGANSHVNVGSIIASTGHISDADLKSNSGRMEFRDVNTGGQILMKGSITVADAGLAAFVAPTVKNSGIITAKMGKVAMAAGDRVTLDLYGDGLVEIAANDKVNAALLENKGTINAEGGTVVMSARDARAVADTVINMEGVINASSATVKGGKIILSGHNGNVSVSGTMNTSGSKGGTIEVKGQNVKLVNTSTLTANSVSNKAAGDITVVGTDTLQVNGLLSAKGLDTTGFIETSAPGVDFGNNASVTTTGEWLLDPTNITINNALAGLLEGQLIFGNATVTTPTAGAQAGNINVNSSIDWSSSHSLKLNAINNVALNANGAVQASGNGNFTANAGNNFSIAGGSAGVKLNGGDVSIHNGGVFSGAVDSVHTAGTGAITLNQNSGGSIQTAVNAIQNSGSGQNVVTVGDGAYSENVSITDSNFKLLSENGRNATSINGVAGVGALGTVLIGNNANNVQVGGTGKGFTINGFDNGNPGIENAAVYFQGAHNGAVIRGNDIVANGDLGLETEYGQTNTNLTIDSNIFSGQTFVGPTWATGNQFTVPNVSRQLAVFNPGSSNVQFTNNKITGNSGQNYQVTIDANNATITGNDFAGTTKGGASLRVRGTSALIDNNTFHAAGLSGNAIHMEVKNSAYTGQDADHDSIGDLWANNNFVGNATYSDNDLDAASDYITRTIQQGVDYSAAGATVTANATTFEEQVEISKDLTLKGANAGIDPNTGVRGQETVIKSPVTLTKSYVSPYGTNKAIVMVHDANNVVIDGVVVNGAQRGAGNQNFTGIGYYNAGGEIKNSEVKNVGNNPFDNGQDGNAILVDNYNVANAHTVDVTDNFVHDFQKNGITFNDAGLGGTISGNVVEGLGVMPQGFAAQNGIQVAYGANATISGNTISKIGYSDPSYSAASILIYNVGNDVHVLNNVVKGTGVDIGVASYFTDNVDIRGNTINGSGIGVDLYEALNTDIKQNFIKNSAIGIQASSFADGTRIFNNSITGNTQNVVNNTSTTLDASGNWWGTTAEGDILSTMQGSVDFTPYLGLGADTDAATGFQGDFSNLYVTNLGDQVQTGGRVSEAVDLLADGSLTGVDRLVHVGAGTFVEQVEITKDMTLKGANAGVDPNTGVRGDETIIQSPTTLTKSVAGNKGVILVHDTNDVVIDGIVVDGAHNGAGNSNFAGVVYYNAGGKLKNSEVENIGNNPFDGGQDGNAIYVSNNDDSSRRVDLKNNYVHDFQKNGITFNGENLRGTISDNVIVGSGPVDYVAQNGIQIGFGANSTVSGNNISGIGYTGEAYDAASILVYDAGNNVNILNNIITGTGVDLGVAIIDTNGALVDGNTISGSGYAVYVDPSPNTVVSNNIIDNTSADAIAIFDSANSKVLNNQIGTHGGNIQGDGVYVTGSNGIIIRGNSVNDTRFTTPDSNGSDGNGIQVINSDGVTIGGNGLGQGNTITNTTNGDGIRLQNNSNVTATHNIIDNVGRVGIYGGNVSIANISDNSIDHGHLSGYGEISTDGGSDWDIRRNNLTNGDAYGIRLNGTGGTNIIRNNDINGTTLAGIRSENISNLTIDKNRIGLNDGAGADGIYVTGGNNLMIGGATEGDGNSINNSGDDGIDIENVGGSVEVANNIINGTAPGFVGADGNNGIEVSGTTNATIHDNIVKNAGWDGINLQQASGTQIVRNTINNTLGASGIGLINGVSDTFIDHNTIRNSQQFGMYLGDTSSGLTVTNNIVKNVTDSDGIYLASGSGTININENTVSNTGANGIRIAQNASQVNGNTVFNTGNSSTGDGIQVHNSANVQIQNNKIGMNAANVQQGAGNVNGNGIEVVNSAGAGISGNQITQTTGHGIFVDPSNGAVISNNNIHKAGLNGIYSLNNDNVTITQNDVSGSGLDGILVVGGTNVVIGGANSTDANIVKNSGVDGIEVKDVAGTVSVSHNIVNGAGLRGISVLRSPHVNVDYNIVKNTDEDGILVNNSDFARINHNKVSNTTGSGIKALGSVSVEIDHNHVNLAGASGIVGDGLSLSSLTHNNVTNTTLDGIDVKNSNNVSVRHNDITSADGYGILLSFVTDSNVRDNTLNTIGSHGIFASNTNGIRIAKNDVSAVTGAGIFALNSADISILNNIVFSTGLGGIRVENVDGSRVTNNNVSQTTYDGIYVGNGSSSALVNKNQITETGGNGVAVIDSTDVKVRNNQISQTDGNGIFVDPSSFVDVNGNTISGTVLDGIHAEKTSNLRVLKNSVTSAGGDGIDVRSSAGAAIYQNDVYNIAENGIRISNSGSAIIRSNNIDETGEDGVFVRNSDSAFIFKNKINKKYGGANSGDDGIDVRNSDGVIIQNNSVDHTHDDGIALRNSDNAFVSGNNIRKARHDGIDVKNGAGGNITQNNVRFSGDNGIEIGNSTQITVDHNLLAANATSGIQLTNVDGMNILFNTINDSGVQGFYARGGANGLVTLSGNTLNNNPIGAKFESGTFDLTGDSNFINGGVTGMLFDRFGGTAPMSLVAGLNDTPGTSGTFGTTNFNGQSGDYITLANNAFSLGVNDPVVLDVTYSNFDNFSPNDRARNANGVPILTQAEYDNLESRLTHFYDSNTLGLLLFGIVPNDIAQEDLFRYFQFANLGQTGLNVTVTGFPTVPGGPAAVSRTVRPFAANTLTASNLNNIQTAAGGDDSQQATGTGSNLNSIETAAGGGDTQQAACWGDAVNVALQGQAVSYSFSGDMADTVSGAARCSSGGKGQF